MLLQQDQNKYSVLQIFDQRVAVLSFCYQMLSLFWMNRSVSELIK